jgi:hypothetical protein
VPTPAVPHDVVPVLAVQTDAVPIDTVLTDAVLTDAVLREASPIPAAVAPADELEDELEDEPKDAPIGAPNDSSEDTPEDLPTDIPARVPARGRITPPAARSAAASWALVTGVAPLLVSVVGNLVAAQLGVTASEQVAGGDEQGAWAPVFVVLALVFVANAALLTVCTILGGRALRDTANGITRGRPLAVAGLAIGGVNLVLWVSGLIVTVSDLGPVLL